MQAVAVGWQLYALTGNPLDLATQPPAVKTTAAVEAQWFLRTDDTWAKPYFDPADLHTVDRKLFA